MSTEPKWSDKLPEDIVDEIRERTDDLSWRFPDDDYIPEFIGGFRNGYEFGAGEWAIWKIKSDRYEKALKLIEQMSDPGDYWKAICDMKAIANEALTPKTSADATE